MTEGCEYSDGQFVCMQVVELRYIRTRDEQLKILRACHVDPTSGHLGEKKTVCRISERVIWRERCEENGEPLADYAVCIA